MKEKRNIYKAMLTFWDSSVTCKVATHAVDNSSNWTTPTYTGTVRAGAFYRRLSQIESVALSVPTRDNVGFKLYLNLLILRDALPTMDGEHMAVPHHNLRGPKP